MIRWIAIAATLSMLGGCVTTEYVYRDRYYDGHLAPGHYAEDTYYADGSYYSPPRSGYGDYYYAPDYYSWYEYPAYSSLFWPLHRSWYDPYWYPNYYYGVTFFPRNYLSIGYSYGWPRYRRWYYSPYRYSWVDNYYDWRPWYRGHNNHYPPRYGSARNEAERLSRRADEGWGYGRVAERQSQDRRDTRVSDAVRRTPYGTYGASRDPARDADYGNAAVPRRDRGAAYGRNTRQDPGMRGFGVPMQPGARVGSEVYSSDAQYGAQREARRRGAYESGLALPRSRQMPAYDRGGYSRGQPSEAMRAPRAAREYDSSGDVRVSREYAQPERSGYEAPVSHYGGSRHGDDAGVRAAPSYSAPEPQSFQTPEPSVRDAPRFEARESRETDYSRSESRSHDDSRDEVRRVGNNRDD